MVAFMGSNPTVTDLCAPQTPEQGGCWSVATSNTVRRQYKVVLVVRRCSGAVVTSPVGSGRLGTGS